MSRSSHDCTSSELVLTEPAQRVTVMRVKVTAKASSTDLRHYVVVAPGLSMPRTVTVHVEDLNGYNVELVVGARDGRLVASEVRVCEREGGPAVTGEVLRSIPVATLTKHAAAHALDYEYRDGVASMKAREFTPGYVENVRAAGPVAATLEAVAYLYRLAVLMGEPPTKTVEQTLELPRSTAGRWVALARKEGFLGAAEGPGKAGG